MLTVSVEILTEQPNIRKRGSGSDLSHLTIIKMIIKDCQTLLLRVVVASANLHAHLQEGIEDAHPTAQCQG